MPIYTPLRFRISLSPRNPKKKQIPSLRADGRVRPGRTTSAAARLSQPGRATWPDHFAAPPKPAGPRGALPGPRDAAAPCPGRCPPRRRPPLPSPSAGAAAAASPSPAARRPPPHRRRPGDALRRPPVPSSPAAASFPVVAGEQFRRRLGVRARSRSGSGIFRLTSLPRNPNFRAIFDCLYLRNRRSVLGV